MNVDLIGIHGEARVGKGAVAGILGELYGFEDWQFAKPIYDLLYKLNPSICVHKALVSGYGFHMSLAVLVDRYGWDCCKEQYPEIRHYLQVLGTEGGRMVHGEDCWIKVAADRMRKLDEQSPTPGVKQPIAFSDIRFENEMEWIKKWGGVTVKIIGPKRGAVSEEAKKHSSENGLPDELFDYVIYNTGSLDDLRACVCSVMEHAEQCVDCEYPVYFGAAE